MGERWDERARRFADAQGARATWFAPAASALDLIAKIGLVGQHDRLVICADVLEQVRAALPWARPCVASAGTAEAFLAATVFDDDAEDAVPEGSPASYASQAGLHGGRQFWLVPSIGGAGLRVPDLRELARAANRMGAILLVDNTLATGFGCQPLKLGAHVSFEAMLPAGGCCFMAISVAPSLRGRGRKRVALPYAEEAYRLLSFGLGAPGTAPACAEEDARALAASLDTLGLRAQQRADHARAIAEYLRCHRLVGCVRYPGLITHPDHDVATGVLTHGFGPAVDFCLTGAPGESAAERHERFLDCCALPQASGAGPVPGGATSICAMAPQRDASYMRIFAGTDDPLYVADSLDQALRLFCNPPEP